jgi:hypothetical protein
LQGYQVAAAGVSPVGFRKKDAWQKIVKNMGLDPPYGLYAPKAAEDQAGALLRS